MSFYFKKKPLLISFALTFTLFHELLSLCKVSCTIRKVIYRQKHSFTSIPPKAQKFFSSWMAVSFSL